MMKQFLIKHWISVVFIGLLTFFYFEKAQDSKQKTQIINQVMDIHEEDKRELDAEIDSLVILLKGSMERVDTLSAKYREVEIKLNKIRYEKFKVNTTVPTYTDAKLDSIISNHRHIRSK